MGIRQCGKTFIARQFAEENYKHVVYINFFKQEERKTAFYGSKDADTIILNLSAQMRNAKFVPGETCIILDEIQDCPEARTSLKFFKEDGRYDIIATGSLLGVQGYGQDEKKKRTRSVAKQNKGSNSVPVGYEQIVEMYPLDFEEFLWANNMSEEIIDVLKRCLAEEKPVPEGIHVAMKTLLYRYVAVGGLPAAVNALIETGNMNEVNEVWKSILKEYRSDMVKYAEDKDKPHIRACFNAIPKQLAKENKKYQYSKVESGGRGVFYKDSLQWLEDADIIRRCYNSNITGLPLEGNAIDKLESMLQSVVAIIGGVDERFDELCDKLSEVDKKIVDIEHYIEFGKFNCYQGWICFKILQNLLQQRRQYKNEMEVINKIRCCKIESKEVDILKASIEQIKFKKYTPRAFKELFNGYCNQGSE